MIAIEFKNGQGLGNQLWNYAVLRSIAKFKNFEFKVLNYEKFKAKDFLYIKEGETKGDLEINKFTLYREKLFFDTDLKCNICSFDPNIFNICDNTIIEGVLQDESYLKPDLDEINKFIKIKDFNFNKIKNFDNVCFLNIRGGEYKLHRDLILPKKYWVNAIKNMRSIRNNLEFKIITDDYNYAKNLFPNLEIIKGNIKDDFLNLYFAKYLILSNSSFAYFPVKMGSKPNNVIAPKNWARFGNKFNKWVGLSNYYSDWLWQDLNGTIIKAQSIENSIKKSYKEYSTYNVLTSEKISRGFKLKKLIPKNLKKILKKIFSRIFPLLIG